MKRYLAFAGRFHYPSGGVNDLQGDYDSITDAQNRLERYLKDQQYMYNYTDEEIRQIYWAHVFDQQTKTKAFSFNEFKEARPI